MDSVDHDIHPLTYQEEEVLVQRLSSQIGGRMDDFNSVIQDPNCERFEDVVPRLNGEGTDDPKAITASHSWQGFGTLVDVGCIKTICYNGTYTAVGPGRWRLWNPRAEFSSGSFLGARFQHFNDGPITVLRIPNGHYALCWEGTNPVVISGEKEGFHAVNSEYFSFKEYVPITSTHIHHGPYHVIRVPRGHYGLVMESGRPALLPRGKHVFNSQTFRFVGLKSMDDASFRHETITRFIVRAGYIGLAWKEKTNAIFLQKPGTYLVDSAMFEYERTVRIEEKEITCGNKKIITVKDGEVGISHDNGELAILTPGRHFIKKPGHHFDEFISCQQRGLALEKEDTRDGFMVCETRELVRVGVQAFVFYHIQDPRKAVVKIGPRRQIEKLINETATAVITTIIRSTSLAEISKASKKEKKVKTMMDSDDEEEEKVPEREGVDPNLPFFDRVKDDFIHRLQENFLNDYGIFMLNIRIGDFKVLEDSISRQIANHALITAETQANLANLEGRRQIDLVNKDSDARIEKMTADVEAHRVITSNKAKAQAIRDKAAAQAQSRKVEAEAKARAVTIKAQAAEAEASAKQKQAEARAHTIQTLGEAEAKATRMRGEAEAKRAEKLGATELGREEALAAINADMVSGAMKGLKKVVYMPTELQRNPFAFFNGQDAAFPLTKSGLTQQ